MNRPWWMLIVTIVIGLTALVVGPHIWPMAPDVSMPPANLLPGYIALSATEALAFGFAVAFALFGWPAIRRLGLGPSWLKNGCSSLSAGSWATGGCTTACTCTMV